MLRKVELSPEEYILPVKEDDREYYYIIGYEPIIKLLEMTGKAPYVRRYIDQYVKPSGKVSAEEAGALFVIYALQPGLLYHLVQTLPESCRKEGVDVKTKGAVKAAKFTTTGSATLIGFILGGPFGMALGPQGPVFSHT